jgi:hypothetical protein
MDISYRVTTSHFEGLIRGWRAIVSKHAGVFGLAQASGGRASLSSGQRVCAAQTKCIPRRRNSAQASDQRSYET